MPRIYASSTGGGNGSGGWSISWKTVTAIALISCSTAYGLYQYEHFFPSKRTPATPAASAAAQRPSRATLKDDLEKLNLTADQRKQLTAVEEQSTSTQAKARMAAKVLSPEQRKEFRTNRVEARKEAKARAELRQKKLFPNPQDAAYAKEANAKIREAREARKKAAEQGNTAAN